MLLHSKLIGIEVIKLRDVILKVASDKIQSYGLRKFTMDEIAVELKISKKTLYKYFKSKDELIHQYFLEIVESDKESTLKALNISESLTDKINAMIYSYHKYKLPVKVYDEACNFYPEEWKELQRLKDFKIDLIKETLKTALKDGLIKEDADLDIIGLILENTTNTLLSYEFLSKNNLAMKEAINKVISIILYGILK
ncbi:transcriptional regulator, TetR family [Clostridiales bacterium oral taxon 876 str. F0540]|nr:transcriptional regulator, TetR family [Clostridiales bacterium oral taxon 876 str. F0540]